MLHVNYDLMITRKQRNCAPRYYTQDKLKYLGNYIVIVRKKNCAYYKYWYLGPGI
jgi:hypothetical protein